MSQASKTQRALQQENLMLKLQLEKLTQILGKAKGTVHFLQSESQHIEERIDASTSSCDNISSHLDALCQHQNELVDRINHLELRRVNSERKLQPLMKDTEKIEANLKREQEKERMRKKITSQITDQLKSELDSKNVELKNLQDILSIKEKNRDEENAVQLNLLEKFQNIQENFTTKQENSLLKLVEKIETESVTNAKNRQLENELTDARANNESLTAQIVILKQQLQKSEEQISELKEVISKITNEKMYELQQKTEYANMVKNLERRIRDEIEDNSKKNREIQNLRSVIQNYRNKRSEELISYETPKIYRKDTTSDNDSITSICSSKISFLQYSKKTIERPIKRKYCGLFGEKTEIQSHVTFQQKRTKTERNLAENIFSDNILN